MTWPGKLDCRDYTVENLATLSDQKDLLERALEARQELFEKVGILVLVKIKVHVLVTWLCNRCVFISIQLFQV